MVKIIHHLPNLKIINPITREEITSTTLNASILSNSLNSVNIVVPPKGLQSITHEIFAVNNDNGSTINRLVYTATGASAGLCTCYISDSRIRFLYSTIRSK